MMITYLDPRPFEALYNRITKTQRAAVLVPAEVTRKGASFLLAQLRRNLSGVPGMPQPDTRAYLNSWRIVALSIGPRQSIYQVVTSHPASHRLEAGFRGIDALGRSVSQAPRPHIAPAVRTTRAYFHNEMIKINARLWRG